MSKSIRRHLCELPEPYATLALKNVEAHSFKSASSKSPNVSNALLSAFFWEDTPEGYEFWAQVTRWARYNLDMEHPKLPEIPEDK